MTTAEKVEQQQGNGMEFPRKGESYSGSIHGYTVEARLIKSRPGVIGGMMLDERWQQVRFTEAKQGVPMRDPFGVLRSLGLLEYSAAQALRWWFHAEADAQLVPSFSLETRLVKHSVKYSAEATAVSAHSVIGPSDRSNRMSDWEDQPASGNSGT